MSESSVGEELRRLRREAALSQRELAALAGVPQPNIAAYESGHRQPSAETLGRLGAALRVPSLKQVRASRERILGVAARRRVSDVRVFGSVARGDATPGSDVDLLVHPAPDASLFDLAGFLAETAELLGIDVDVVSDRGTGPSWSASEQRPWPSDGRRRTRADTAGGHRAVRGLRSPGGGARPRAVRRPRGRRAAPHRALARPRPDIDWSGIRAVRAFVAHDHVGTDMEVLWRMVAVEFARIAQALTG